MLFTKSTLSIIGLAAITYSGGALASSCSKVDIDHYLKSGFTHDQVVKLCTDNATPASSGSLYQSISKPNARSVAPSATSHSPAIPAASTGRNEDQVYFETVIEANPVTLTNDQLIFERKECAAYGDLDMTQTREKACVNTRTSINLKGLEVVRATKGIILIREQELVVKGNITREYLNISRLNKYKAAAVREQLPTHPTKFDIPVKKGIDPTIVATKLGRYK